MLKIGDKVGYSGNFMRSIQGDYTISRRRGVIVEIVKEEYARVEWEDGPVNLVRLDNIAIPGSAKF
jgi:hypothetical protein